MRRRELLAGLAGVAVAGAGTAHAQANWPTRPIHLVVPFTPGGSTDILARSIGLELTKAWGQSVVIDNVPGAGGSIGADRVAKAPADGYTLLMGHIGTLAVTPSIYPSCLTTRSRASRRWHGWPACRMCWRCTLRCRRERWPNCWHWPARSLDA